MTHHTPTMLTPPPAPRPEPATPAEPFVAGVPRTVFLLGVTSFLADFSGEMVYPFVPLFLTTVLGAPVAVVGLIEGLAEGTASIVRVFAGVISDRMGKRLPLVVGGYGLATVGKLLLAVATLWPVVLLARFVDRFGKGVRGSPRDALIAEAAPPAMRGRAFGFHRSMDTAGAVIGPLVGLGLVALFNDELRWVFAVAVVPGILSVLSLGWIRERSTEPAPHSTPPRLDLATVRRFDRRLLVFLGATTLFALGNSSDVFLILRAHELGLSTTAVALAYVLYNFVYMAAALPAGVISDRVGRRGVFVLGLVVFALVYTGFALITEAVFVWPLLGVYGLYIALTDGVGKALIADLAPSHLRATALGVYGTLTGVAALLASVVAGQLWERVSVGAPFALGAVAALAAAIVLLGGSSGIWRRM